MSHKERVVVLSGAGISAESGLSTFRGDGGLWEGHNVYEVATPEAWERDSATVLRFYNWRRGEVRRAPPNAAHRALARLQEEYLVTIITQNVDDLHERAGSRDVLHLHGEILKARSSRDPDLIIELGDRDIAPGDRCPHGSQLRPHVVWFGEPVTEIHRALAIVREADILLVVGTSLQVYPAASLLPAAEKAREIWLVNPEVPEGLEDNDQLHILSKKAGEGVPAVVEELRNR